MGHGALIQPPSPSPSLVRVGGIPSVAAIRGTMKRKSIRPGAGLVDTQQGVCSGWRQQIDGRRFFR